MFYGINSTFLSNSSRKNWFIANHAGSGNCEMRLANLAACHFCVIKKDHYYVYCLRSYWHVVFY